MEEEEGWDGSVEGGRQLHLSFVSFQQKHEREKFFRVEPISAAEREC